MISKSNLVFVCCVESGYLETHTVRMLESLRRWGGEFANVPIFAITPRFGPPISEKTRHFFKRYQVEHIYFVNQNKYSWNKFLNKLLALIKVEEVIDSEFIGWLDSDLIFVDEPDEFNLNPNDCFIACPSDTQNLGATGTEKSIENYWCKICQYFDMDIEDLFWIHSEPEGEKMRFYLNSGVFIYRRSIAFSQHYLETFIRLCESRIASQKNGLFFNDQVALALTVTKMGIPWRKLPYSHNFGIGSIAPHDWYIPEKMKTAKIIHYHDSMWSWFWDSFIESMSSSHPAVTEWLISLGAMRNEAPMHYRATKKLLDIYRKRQESAYLKSCKVF
ncbi:MAG: hypothetical protein HC903_11825 [Methylacidiphilales bacterium]|nr:hypothetical protein [Candidatus Methylacidiphilales bacterium]NJR17807.1 hypothetical protein [Calothrix sp. CSU_2_0]